MKTSTINCEKNVTYFGEKKQLKYNLKKRLQPPLKKTQLKSKS